MEVEDVEVEVEVDMEVEEVEVEVEEVEVEVEVVDLYPAAISHCPDSATASQFAYRFLRILCMDARTEPTSVLYPHKPIF